MKLDVTPFQLKVYKAIKQIPKGRVRSYQWVAKKIGRPRAYRAVGNALNKNPHPIIIPCHRVVKSDGSLGGFAKGTRHKLRLLRTEGLTLEKIRDIIKRRINTDKKTRINTDIRVYPCLPVGRRKKSV